MLEKENKNFVVSHKLKKIFFITFREIFLWFNILLMLAPFIFMVFSATKTNVEFLLSPFTPPANFWKSVSENFMSVMTGEMMYPSFGGEVIKIKTATPFLVMFKNTAIVTVLSLIGMLILSLLVGYSLGTKQFKGKSIVMIYIIIIQAVPFFGYMMAMLLVSETLNLTNTLLGIVPIYIAVSMPMAIILFQGFFKSFPKAIEEAAEIDGAKELQKFCYIIIPMSKGMIASLAIINLMGYWNEYAIANLLMGQVVELRTINVGIMMATSTGGGDSHYYYIFMLLTLSAIPNFIFFTIFQKKIMAGVSMGGIKG